MEKHLSELLKKYLNGECTPDEIKQVDEWFVSQEQNPDDDRLLDLHERESLQSRMFERIKANAQIETDFRNLKESSPRKIWYRAAAVLIVLMLAGMGFYIYSQQIFFPNHDIDISGAGISQITNDTRKVTLHTLSDGTVITLQPNGSIEFPDVFPSDKREVILKGEAFFDVTKDKNRPFIINTGDVTVKVLGTSFNVRAYEGAEEISVAVKTGRVSVSAKVDDVGARRTEGKKEIILTPNQEVVYNTIDANFSRKIVDDPQIILDNPTLFAMKYDATPVAKIFQVMEENYGIEIEYDENAMASCSLTTSMAEEGLYERIEIICQAIGAKYEMVDGKIVVSSSGCQ